MTGPGVPVVVDLADWSRSTARRLRFPRVRRPPVSPRPLVVWLRATVRERYGIPALVFDAWLAEDRLVLLLDGLDEVPKAHREQCVNEINKLQQSGGHHMVVCSRTRNYESLETQLKLQGAVEIQPLGWEQVAAFLDAGGPRLRAMAPGLAADRELLDVLTTPLMLNVLALTYGDASALPESADGRRRDRRRELFDAFVVEVLARQRARIWRPGSQRALRALRTLARLSNATGSGVGVVPPSFLMSENGLDPVQRRELIEWLAAAAGIGGATALTWFLAERTGELVTGWLGFAAWASAVAFANGVQYTARPTRKLAVYWIGIWSWSALSGAMQYLLMCVLVEPILRVLPPAWSNFDLPAMQVLGAFVAVFVVVVVAFAPCSCAASWTTTTAPIRTSRGRCTSSPSWASGPRWAPPCTGCRCRPPGHRDRCSWGSARRPDSSLASRRAS
jgi:hypothetical protein